MPVENEFNFVIHDPKGRLESELGARKGVRRLEIRQGYLNDDLRIRSIRDAADGKTAFVMSFKRSVAGETVEVEAPMTETDFRKLFKTCDVTLRKTRYAFSEGDVHWDVDFLRGRKDGATYFVKAEAEVPEHVVECPEACDAIAERVIAVPGKRKGFSSRRLSDERYARALMEGLVARHERRQRRDEPTFRMAA